MERREASERLALILRVLKGETREQFPSDHEAMIEVAKRMAKLSQRIVQDLCTHGSMFFSFGDCKNILTGEVVYRSSKDSCAECGKIFNHKSIESIGGVDIKVDHLKGKSDE
jgi:hypothetical protein